MKLVALAAVALILIGAALWLFGPREPVSGPSRFDAAAVGRDLDSYLYLAERDVPNLKRGAQKHILWADPVSKARTPLSVVYVHGFSATLEEVRPVPDNVARALGANLFYARLAGHGRDGRAMGEPDVQDWRDDLSEALEIGARIGEQVLLITTSTGGTLATLALADPAARDKVAGVVFLSPNFGMRDWRSGLLTLPYARTFVPLIIGRVRFFAPENPEHGKWWTTRYPTAALMPLAAAVSAANRVDMDAIDTPALFIFADADQIVSAARTRQVAARWGGPVAVWPVEMRPGDDSSSHVVAGRILSPGLTRPVTMRILEWVRDRRL